MNRMPTVGDDRPPDQYFSPRSTALKPRIGGHLHMWLPQRWVPAPQPHALWGSAGKKTRGFPLNHDAATVAQRWHSGIRERISTRPSSQDCYNMLAYHDDTPNGLETILDIKTPLTEQAPWGRQIRTAGSAYYIVLRRHYSICATSARQLFDSRSNQNGLLC